MSDEYKDQLRIPLTNEEVGQLYAGDHVKVTLSDDSAHEEIILFEEAGDE